MKYSDPGKLRKMHPGHFPDGLQARAPGPSGQLQLVKRRIAGMSKLKKPDTSKSRLAAVRLQRSGVSTLPLSFQI